MVLPVDVLIDEHKLILRAVDVVKGKIGDIKTDKAINPTQITVMLIFSGHMQIGSIMEKNRASSSAS